jgi:hypothetical protein
MPSDDSVVRRTKSSGDESMVALIVDALSEATGTDPTEMTPLAQSVDTDDLEQVVAGSGTTVTFEHADVSVSVAGDGVVGVAQLTREPASTAS